MEVLENEEGLRLDKILAQRFSGIRSRAYFEFLFETNNVLLNGNSVKKSFKPKCGDEISVHFIVTPEIGLTPEAIPLNILFEDEHLIAINKPVGMVVHPAVGNWTGTFVNALLYHCQNLPKDKGCRPGIVHRLDKDTSGVLIAAKTSMAQQKLIEQFSQREIHKEYIAICVGNPGTQEIMAPIGRHPVNRQMMTVRDDGKLAHTICETVKTNGQISLVRIILKTGRTHQIRVHLKHIGFPVLGDSIYGNSQVNQRNKATRQLLHAHRLQLLHPMTQMPLDIEAAIPEDFRIFL